MDRFTRIEGMLETVLRELQHLTEPKKPSLTRADFARASSLSYRTVKRKVDSGELPLVKGRIPYSELRPYLS